MSNYSLGPKLSQFNQIHNMTQTLGTDLDRLNCSSCNLVCGLVR